MRFLGWFLLVALFGCSAQNQTSSAPTATPKAVPVEAGKPVPPDIAKALDEHYAALEANDLDAILATLDPDSPAVESERQDHEALSKWKLKIERGPAVLLEQSGDRATVRFDQAVHAIEGEGFADNASTQTVDLVRRDGKWKIRSSAIENVRFFRSPEDPGKAGETQG